MNGAAGLCLAVMTGCVLADDRVMDLALPTDSIQPGHAAAVRLALNEEDTARPGRNAAPENRQAGIGLPGLTGRKVHQYLGLSTLALVGLTAVTAPENEHGQARSTSGLHPTLGRIAAAMAAATVTTGLLYHWKDFHLEDGLTDQDNLHVLLAGAGALAMLYAISRAPDSGHSSAGVLGGIGMAVAVKVNW
jgi:hypothetical protein